MQRCSLQLKWNLTISITRTPSNKLVSSLKQKDWIMTYFTFLLNEASFGEKGFVLKQLKGIKLSSVLSLSPQLLSWDTTLLYLSSDSLGYVSGMRIKKTLFTAEYDYECYNDQVFVEIVYVFGSFTQFRCLSYIVEISSVQRAEVESMPYAVHYITDWFSQMREWKKLIHTKSVSQELTIQRIKCIKSK